MNQYQKTAQFFKALAHPIRLEILSALSHRALCVCELVSITNRRQANISQHLTLLRKVGLVIFERSGWNIFYRLNHARMARLSLMLKSLFDTAHPNSEQSGIDDRRISGEKHPDSIQWHGISRGEIDWGLWIIDDRCGGCGMCVISCGHRVYAYDYQRNRPAVVAPRRCIVGYMACATLCPQDAIHFPAVHLLRKLIRQERVLAQSKYLLLDRREQFDVKTRQDTREFD